MRKAGIIIGVLFFIVAIVLFFFLSNIDKNEPDTLDDGVGVVENIEDKDKTTKNPENEPEETPETPETPKPVETIIEKVITKEISSVKTINEGTLGEPILENEVITVIANKRIILLDESPDTENKKMLTYCFDVLTPDNTSLILFVTKTVYDAYKIEDKLKVNYEVYKNDIGVEFPIVSTVTSVDR